MLATFDDTVAFARRQALTSSRGRNLEPRDRSKLREALLLLFVGMIITMIGVRILPPKDPAIQFAGQFVVAVPSSMTDATDNLDPVTTVEWTESHGKESANAIRWGGPGNPTSDTTRVALRVGFDHYPGSGPITVSFDIPPGAILDDCRLDLVLIAAGSECTTQPSASADVAGRSDRVVRASGSLGCYAPPFDLLVVADLRHIAGLGYATNRKDATVRYPNVIAIDRPDMDTSDAVFPRPVQVTTEVHFDGASEIRWTQNPSSGFNGVVKSGQYTGTYNDDVTTWDYRFPALGDKMYYGASPPPNITGTREWVSNRDTDRVFYAGVAFGTAAAGYMGAIQALFEWLTSESDSDSSATLKRRRMRLRDKDFRSKAA